MRVNEKTNERIITGYWADVTELQLSKQQLIRTHEASEVARLRLQDTLSELERTKQTLVQSEKLASLGSLVAGLSHELNTPLGNAVLAGTTLSEMLGDMHQRYKNGELKKSKLEKFWEDALYSVTLVNKSVGKAAELMQHFKITAIEQINQERLKFNINFLLQKSVDQFYIRHTGKPWKIIFHAYGNFEMNSFPEPLANIINCLFDNAVSHGFKGRDHGTIEVICKLINLDSKKRNWIEVCVTDDGCGVAPEHASRIFDPFFTTAMGQHPGMGLNVAYRMATTVLGGTIELAASSADHPRTCFVLRLPALAPNLV